MKRSRKVLALALLVPTLIMAACGSGGEQAETAETSTETAETADLETIGAGADETAEPGNTEEDSGTETVEKPEATDFSFIEGWITSVEEDKTELTLIIAHHMKEAKSVEFTYQEVLLDGTAAENWEAHGRGADTFTIDPNAFQSFPQTLVLSTNIDNYSELTVNATANFDDGTKPYPFSATFQISEMERKIEEKAIAASKEIYVEEQEIYHEDEYGNTITVLGMEAGASGDVILALEYVTDGAAAVAFRLDELYIGDTLIYSKSQEVQTVDIEFDNQGGGPGQPISQFIYIKDDAVRELIREELPEISVVFRSIADDTQTPKVSFPVLSK